MVANTTSLSTPVLRISSNNTASPMVYKLTKPKTSIGRDPHCDICINETVVSSYHFEVQEQNGLYYLAHPHPSRIETANGFTYQGRQYGRSERFWHQLLHNDVFRIGDPGGTLVSITYDDGSGDPGDTLPHVEDVSLGRDMLTLGRAPDNDVCLDHEMVSAYHARLEKQGTDYLLVDLQSTNRVYVKGMPVTRHYLQQDDEIRIGPFKFVYDASANVLRNANRSVRIEAQNLCKIGVNKGKEQVRLKNISLVIPSGSFVALVGGSGAGKSTLLKALSGLDPARGVVTYNKQDYYKSYAVFSSRLGYVPQDDIVHRELTVQSALYYGAKLRLPDGYTESRIQKRISEVLDVVGLGNERDKPINKLSGGQRKRVSIALELLASPGIFFLDEPTSGLDPGLDRKMMNLLRMLADKGQTIVLVTHATNNINICDYVCFMGAGHLVYFGPPHLALKFFREPDFANIYNQLNDEQKCKEWSEDFKADRKMGLYQKYIAGPLQSTNNQQQPGKTAVLKSPARRHPLRQWWLLCGRYLELLKNDHGNLAILLIQAPVIALIIFTLIKASIISAGGFDTTNVVQCPRTAQVFTAKGLPDVPSPSDPAVSKDCSQLENILKTTPQGRAYAARRGGTMKALQDFIVPGPGDAPVILFIMAFAAIMCGCINSSREIVKEGPIYQRERTVNLDIFAYLFSKVTVLGTLCLLQSAALVGIIGLADPFPRGTFLPGWVEVYITIALTSLAGLMLGLAISALVSNSDRAMSFLPLLLLPQVVFSGVMFPLHDRISQIIGMLFPVRWGMAALGSTVGIHSDKVFGPLQDGDKWFGNDYSYHGTLFSTYSASDAQWHLIHMWMALGATMLLFFIITSFCLKLKDRRSFGRNREKCIQCRQKLSRSNASFCNVCGVDQFP